MKICIFYDLEKPELRFDNFRQKINSQIHQLPIQQQTLKQLDDQVGYYLVYLQDIGNQDLVIKLIQKVKDLFQKPVVVMINKNEDFMSQLFLVGADDVMFHHYSKEEVLVRLMAVYQRYYEQKLKLPKVFEIGDIKINQETFQITRGNRIIPATKIEYEIIKLLASNPMKVFAKRELYERIWKDQYYDSGNILNVHIRRLRKKIEDNPDNPKIIQTKWGIGYCLNLNPDMPK